MEDGPYSMEHGISRHSENFYRFWSMVGSQILRPFSQSIRCLVEKARSNTCFLRKHMHFQISWGLARSVGIEKYCCSVSSL